MAIPTSYLTTVKNLPGILNSIVGAQAPEKFTTRFLESLDYKTSADRLIIGVLKSLGFLADDGRPTQRYFDYLDQTQSEIVMASAIKDAYSDLFQINKNAQSMSKTEVVNKFKTLSQGRYSESVLDKMATTFTNLCKYADFESQPAEQEGGKDDAESNEEREADPIATKKGLSIGGLVYNIQLILPDSRDPKVYDALFEAMKRHFS